MFSLVRQPFEHSSRSAPGRFTSSSIAVKGWLDGMSANFSRSPDPGGDRARAGEFFRLLSESDCWLKAKVT
jgi:hypothetical protein